MEIYNIKKFREVKVRKRKKDPRYELEIEFFDNISYVLLLDKDELEMLKKVIDKNLGKKEEKFPKKAMEAWEDLKEKLIRRWKEKIEEIIIAWEKDLCPICGIELDYVYCCHCDRNIHGDDYFKKLREVVDGGV